MTASPMSKVHHTQPWNWTLSERQVQTLPAAPVQRWLRVEEGCLWGTRRDSHGQREDDVWLAAGESLALPAGSHWLLEAWPQARLSLLLQAPVPAAAAPAGGPGFSPAWRDLSRRWWRRSAGWMRFSVLHA